MLKLNYKLLHEFENEYIFIEEERSTKNDKFTLAQFNGLIGSSL